MVGVSGGVESAVLLALDAGVRETGWAVFRVGLYVSSGTIGNPGRRSMDASTRISQLVEGLDELVQWWLPGVVAHCQPSGIHWPVPSLGLLEEALRE